MLKEYRRELHCMSVLTV